MEDTELTAKDDEMDQKVQVQDVEEEKKRMQDEFNFQRAKMKELFLQKEAELKRRTQENILLLDKLQCLKTELDDVKSQLVVDNLTLESNFEVEKRKAEEEIATLQQIVHEAVEQNSSTRTIYDCELNKLQHYIKQLQDEILQLKQERQRYLHHNSQEQSSLAPSAVLNVLTKGIAKKLGADAFTSQDNNDDCIRKTHEDAEVLRSLVEPLEDQIKALKEKLRHTDEQLQRCKECGHNQDLDDTKSANVTPTRKVNMQATTSTNTSFESQKQVDGTMECDMCSNYEAQLVKEQQLTRGLEAKVVAAEKATERHKEDLLKEIGFRKDMEEKWNEKKEQHKKQVAELTRSTECTEQDLKEVRQFFEQCRLEMRETLAKLTAEREEIQQELNQLQKENDSLVGKFTMHSQELQSEAINLPDTVEELHEVILKNNQDLILAKIGKEAAEEKANILQSDLLLLNDQLNSERQQRISSEENLIRNMNSLKNQILILEKEKKLFATSREKLANAEKTNQGKIIEMQEVIEDLNKTVKKLESDNKELRLRIYSLQQDLETNETVQKDFVMLSQSLQVQLEKIREADIQVRWQHEEDIEECPVCRKAFSTSKHKEHCRHCGQIFCHSCLTRSVESGPNMRPSKVCDVCHTLLVKSSAPYFSEAPPMT